MAWVNFLQVAALLLLIFEECNLTLNFTPTFRLFPTSCEPSVDKEMAVDGAAD